MKLPKFTFKRSNKSAQHSADPAKRQKTRINALAGTILALLVICVFILIQLEANWHQQQQYNTQQFKRITQQQTQILSTLTKQKALDQHLTALTAQLKAIQNLQTKYSQQIDQTANMLANQTALKTELTQSTQHLTTLINSLQAELSKTRKANKQTPAPASQSNYQTTTAYHLYGVQPYGVILTDTKGQFIIARIGRQLPGLGRISMISADKVIAGHYIITRA